MEFTKFGQTGLTVSRMILGTGTFGKQTDEQEAHRMLDKAAEAGITFIDTADIYPLGAEAGGAEIITGRWLSNKRAGFFSPQRAAEKWGLPLGMQAAHANTCWTPSTLRCAA